MHSDDYAPGDEAYTGPSLRLRTGKRVVYWKRAPHLAWVAVSHCETAGRAWVWLWAKAWGMIREREG